MRNFLLNLYWWVSIRRRLKTMDNLLYSIEDTLNCIPTCVCLKTGVILPTILKNLTLHHPLRELRNSLRWDGNPKSLLQKLLKVEAEIRDLQSRANSLLALPGLQTKQK